MAAKPIDQSLVVPALTKEEQYAIRALSKGEAAAGQQALALGAIIKKLSRAYDLTYLPGQPHESAFLSGRAYVGMNITRIINQKPEEDNNAT